MLRRTPLLIVALAVLALAVKPAHALGKDTSSSKTKRPNILFIVTDDQAPWALGLSGHPHARTPHQDRLFREGAYLVNSFTVTPVCSPSRASLMTSRYGTEVAITDWIHPKKEAELGLDPKSLVWPRLFAQAGYRTGLIGKWHLGTQDHFHPTAFGYQTFMGFRSGGSVPKDAVLEVDGQNRKMRGFLPDVLTDEAIRFLRQSTGQPFLLSLHFRAPHARWLPVAEEDWAPFKNLDPTIPNPAFPKLDVPRVKRMTNEYLASTASVDRNIGRLLDVLDQFELTKNTIVIYTSDHGYNMGHNGIWHKGNGHWVLTEPPPATTNIPRNQRPNMYDHSIRVPTGIRWPGTIKPGTVIDETVANIDWFPTLLSMAGIDMPDRAVVRGRDCTPVLKGDAENWDNDLFCQYSTHHQSRTHMRMFRTSQWKLIRDFKDSDRDELFDLQRDPAESKNLIGSDDPTVKAIVADLHEKLLKRMVAIDDPALADTK